MKKLFCILASFCLSSTLHAQYKVKIILKEKTAIYHDSIFVTGSFSGWDSTTNKTYMLKGNGPEKSIVLNLKAGELRYKFHRGNWFKVEKQFNTGEIPDRVIHIRRDTTLTDSVMSWRDETLVDKKYSLTLQQPDSSRIKLFAAIAYTYAFFPEYYNADSALYYAQKGLELHQKVMSSDAYKEWLKLGNSIQLLNIQEVLAGLLHAMGNYPKALELRFQNLSIAESGNDKIIMVQTIRNITLDYAAMKDYQNVLKYSKTMSSILATVMPKENDYLQENWFAKSIIASAFYHLNMPDSALYYAKQVNEMKLNTNTVGYAAFTSQLLGDIYTLKAENDTAFYYYKLAIEYGHNVNASQVVGSSYAGIARIFQKKGQQDSALYYARQAFDYYQNNTIIIQAWGENIDSYIAEISPVLAELYKANNQPDSAYKYLKLSVALKDSLYNANKMRQFQTLTFNEANRHQQLEQQANEVKRQYKTKVKILGLATGLFAVIILAYILYRNNKQKQKANTILQSQKEKIEATLAELQHTQKQLVQSEKMASLGELTAGIAHEIQNPLNFVNNFSEVNKELVDELQQELKAGKIDAAISISNDIRDNEEKINHHGKRADAIVKGMLQHSQASKGKKEPTDINALCDEYLRLSYHGLRAKDKNFNATLKTDFDNSIEKIDIIPQDIGRVVLNLINNAFYAVAEKKKESGDSYEPTVSVKTFLRGSPLGVRGISISISDNGNGIPQNIVDKIFQPFFTTKPTGQGTGLGLSLSYDIIKAKGGEIKVETKEEEGTTFIILLPENT